MARKVVITLDDRLFNELRVAANTCKMSVENFIAAFLWEHSIYNDCEEQYSHDDE